MVDSHCAFGSTDQNVFSDCLKRLYDNLLPVLLLQTLTAAFGSESHSVFSFPFITLAIFID